MSKKQKQLSERRHGVAQNTLRKAFPDCEVIYQGVEGLDHQINHKGRITWVETKTCSRIVRSGIMRNRNPHSPVLFERLKLGNFSFNKTKSHPYKISQHHDLVELNGWYVFVVGGKGYIVAGIPARHMRLNAKTNVQRMSWGQIISLCSPDWVNSLKLQVYNGRIPRQKKITGRLQKLHDLWIDDCTERSCPIIEHLLSK